MKSAREQRALLNAPALNLLQAMQTSIDHQPTDFIFPGTRGLLSDKSHTSVLRHMKVEATTHGFRSTFRNWAAEFTAHPNVMAELALAHAHAVGDKVGDKVDAACRSGDLFGKRVALMADWARFLKLWGVLISWHLVSLLHGSSA